MNYQPLGIDPDPIVELANEALESLLNVYEIPVEDYPSILGVTEKFFHVLTCHYPKWQDVVEEDLVLEPEPELVVKPEEVKLEPLSTRYRFESMSKVQVS